MLPAATKSRREKFDSPESSAALAANAFSFFLHEAAADLPPLPGCEGEVWPARSLYLEVELRFAWRGGRHPVLDCVVQTPSGSSPNGSSRSGARVARH